MEHSPQLPDRCWASLPANDPRFADLRAQLADVQGRGKASPMARMLGEYALLGYLLTTGRIPSAAEAQPGSAAINTGVAPEDVRRSAAALTEFAWE